MLLLASHFSHVQLSAVPWTIAHRPHCPWDSPGKNTGVACHFLLQGIFWPRDQTHVFWIGRWFLYHWATCEDLSWFMKVKAAQSCLTLQPRPEHWSGQPFPSPGDLPNSGIKPRLPTLQADSLPAEPQGKPKNKGVGSLSLLPWIFPTQESNQGFLHCRQVLYQLSYQGSSGLFHPIKEHMWKYKGKI